MLRKVLIKTLILLITFKQIAYAAQVNSSPGSVIIKMLLYLLAILFVLLMAMYGTRFIVKNTKRFVTSKYMKIVDVINLGTNFKILMLEINENIYIIAVTSSTIEIIDKFSKEQIVQRDNFDEHLNKYISFKRVKYLDNIYKNIESFVKRIDNINDEEEVDHDKNK